MLNEVELAIVGAGPAGIEAAITASKAGVDVTLIDMSPTPGGHYFQQSTSAFQTKNADPSPDKARRFINRLSTSKVRVLENTLVWGLFEGPQPGTWCLTLHGADAPARLQARAVLLATGAFDRSVPFPGWDLPGVLTAGAALKMIKHQHVLPGRRVVLSGTGPLQLQTAALLVQAGAEVLAVCECATSLPWRSVPHLPSVWGQWGRLQEGLGFLRILAGARVPYWFGWAITRVEGEDQASQATLSKLDNNGQPTTQLETIRDIDAVIVGYGLTPRTELCRQLGCELIYDALLGGFIPRRDEYMQTSLRGIFAAGDGAGLVGAEAAIIEGRIAGYALAARLGHVPPETAHKFISQEKPALRRERRFGRMLGALFSPPASLYNLAKPETVICRCEQVALGQLREAVSFGAQSVNDVKNLVRIGMGNCQGRTCGTITAQILAAETGKTVEEVRYFSIRPPIHPLPLEVIEEYDKVSGPGGKQA